MSKLKEKERQINMIGSIRITLLVIVIFIVSIGGVFYYKYHYNAFSLDEHYIHLELWSLAETLAQIQNIEKLVNENHYPRGISVLYYETHEKSNEPYYLIQKYIANADILSKGKVTITTNEGENKEIKFDLEPARGFWFALIPKMEDGTFYDKNKEKKFAVCAFPADPTNKFTRYTFIVNEKGIVYCKKRENNGIVEQWPENPVEEGWRECYYNTFIFEEDQKEKVDQ